MSGVIIYTLRGCPTCVRAKRDLAADGVEFEEREIDHNQHWWEEANRLAIAVPIILREGRVEVGWKGETG